MQSRRQLIVKGATLVGAGVAATVTGHDLVRDARAAGQLQNLQ